MKYLKVALFSFICSIVLALTAEIIHVEPLLIPAVLCILTCVGCLLAYFCTRIFHRFRHSLTVILIIIFLVLSVTAFILAPDTSVRVETVSELSNLSYLALIGVASALACCISFLVLVGQLIFGRREEPPAPPQQEEGRD